MASLTFSFILEDISAALRKVLFASASWMFFVQVFRMLSKSSVFCSRKVVVKRQRFSRVTFLMRT